MIFGIMCLNLLDLRECIVIYQNWFRANLYGANLYGAILTRAILRGTILEGQETDICTTTSEEDK
ncbi:MAG: pentapeptide repeat-containing protein [Cyanobacteria bacterium SBLK]|nr:pentapeptide repeat-containing protein [Cyanobacteria bacterium SBLK]